MYSDDHCPSGQVISLANRWKKYIDNITPPPVSGERQRAALSKIELQNRPNFVPLQIGGKNILII